ncbi:MAG: glycosyltransferase family 4 protein [Chloroflexi bacterium]|nr:glycosyltransferase family 4 protein [Chloroflexota bacterium]
MKIGQVSPYDYTYPGGVTAHIHHLKRHLTGLGHEVKIIAPCTKGRPTYLDEKVISIGRPFPYPSGGSIARIDLSLKTFGRVDEVLRSEKFDIVHIHEPFTPTISLAAMIYSKSMTVGTFHAYHTKPRGYFIWKPILSRLLPRLDMKIAVSQPARDFVNRHLKAEYRIVPNGIDVEKFSSPAPPLEQYKDGKFNILFVGRLEKRKGFDCLLKAYARVRCQFSDVRLIIVGPGSRLRGKYERYIRKQGITDIVFAGYVGADELPRYYAVADVFCAPANGGESFGIVLLEAMASGTPVIATRIPGYSSVVTDGVDGILVSPRDDEAMSRALIKLIAEPATRQALSRNGRKTAEAYRWEQVTGQVLDIYNELLEGKARPK